MTSVLDAWQGALAAEHAAIFGYGVAGPHLAAGDVTLARQAQAAHEALRDRVEGELSALGVTPAAPQADYPLPFAITGPEPARRLALRIEEACAAAWRYVVAVAADPRAPRGAVPANRLTALRTEAQSALTDSAVRAVRWRRLITPAAPTVPFPGI